MEKLFIKSPRTRMLVWGMVALVSASAFILLELGIWDRLRSGPTINGLPLWLASLFLLNHLLGCVVILSTILTFSKVPLVGDVWDYIFYGVVFGIIPALMCSPILTPLWLFIATGAGLLDYDRTMRRMRQYLTEA